MNSKQYLVFWESVEGNPHTEYFVTPHSHYASYDVSYVHVWHNPEDGVRAFIKHVPLNNLRIMFFDEG